MRGKRHKETGWKEARQGKEGEEPTKTNEHQGEWDEGETIITSPSLTDRSL